MGMMERSRRVDTWNGDSYRERRRAWRERRRSSRHVVEVGDGIGRSPAAAAALDGPPGRGDPRVADRSTYMGAREDATGNRVDDGDGIEEGQDDLTDGAHRVNTTTCKRPIVSLGRDLDPGILRTSADGRLAGRPARLPRRPEGDTAESEAKRTEECWMRR